MTQPTDDEISAAVTSAKVKCVHPDAQTTLDIARAILEKFGAPQRAPLTDDEILLAFCGTPGIHQFVQAFKQGVRFAERVHGVER